MLTSDKTVGAALAAALVRKDFPILSRQVHGKPLIYLDSTASSQKPRAVIAAMSTYYETYNANVHRGVYEISEEATAAMEKARVKVARFINARFQHQTSSGAASSRWLRITFASGTAPSALLPKEP